jgi:DNA helicase-2/ATP-dependent DNA helicase PcrA
MLDNKILEHLTSKGGNHLIIGPPGSGKTYTLLAIVKHLLDKKNIDPSRILIFTFNRRWSKILREETVKLVNRSIWEIPIGTFFSFCNDFLAWRDLKEARSGGNRIASKAPGSRRPENKKNDFTVDGTNIVNSATQWNLLKEVISVTGQDDYPYSYRYFNSTRYVANSFLQEVFDFILRAQENLLEPEELLQRFTPHNNPVLSELSGIYSRYIDKLHGQGKRNYGILLQETEKILRGDAPARMEWQEKYEYILVDELQETNKAQMEIIKNISRDNCIFFGNDDQAIYNFRGGVSDNFLQVYRNLKVSSRVYFLEKNYRSAKNIVDLSNNFLKSGIDRISKKNIGISSGGEVQVKDFNSILEETEYIAGRIKALEEDEKIKPEKIAIIIKGLGYETHLLENALRHNGIAFMRRSSRSMLDNHHVLYIINYLRLIISIGDPVNEIKSKNDQAPSDEKGIKTSGHCYDTERLLDNHLLSELTGLDPLFYIKLRSDYIKHCSQKKPDTAHNNKSFWNYICEDPHKNVPDIQNDDPAVREKLRNAVSLINKSLKKIGNNIYEFLMDFIEDPASGLFQLLEDKGGISLKDHYYSAWVGIGDFLESVKEYTRTSPDSDIRSYMDYLENLIDNSFLEEIEESTREQSLKGTVNILSFHQCKGMEYTSVFIPFINNNYLPSKFRQPQIFDLQVFRAIKEGEECSLHQLQKEHMEGEIRLLFNGITRAREKLFITSSRSRGVSTFFERIRAAAEDIDSKKKDDINIVRTEKGNQEKWKIPYETDKRWLLKKKTMVSLVRLAGGLKVDYKRFIKRTVELKYFYPGDEWWNLVEPTVNSNSPFNKYPPIFNYSSLNTYRDCPFKYKIKYFYKVPEEDNLSLKTGKIYHNALKEFFNRPQKDRTWEEFAKVIEKNFEEEKFDFSFIKKELLTTAMKDLKRYYEKFIPPSDTKVIMEEGFNFKLASNGIRGRIDQINQLPDGNTELIDFKSGSSRYSRKDLEDEIQLRFYKLALDSDRNLKKFKQGRVILKYLILGDNKKTEYTLPEDHYDKKDIESVLGELIRKIKKESFSPLPGKYMSCRYCDYKTLCPRFYG